MQTQARPQPKIGGQVATGLELFRVLLTEKGLFLAPVFWIIVEPYACRLD